MIKTIANSHKGTSVLRPNGTRVRCENYLAVSLFFKCVFKDYSKKNKADCDIDFDYLCIMMEFTCIILCAAVAQTSQVD